MRICLVCGEYPPGPHGGIGTVTQTLARALVREGHEVRVVGSCRGDYPGPEREHDQGVDVLRLRETPQRLGWMRARIRLFSTIAGWCRRGDVDLVEAPDYAGSVAYWPRLAVPVVVRVHGSVSYFAAELGQDAGRALFRLERASLRRADAWCAVSCYAAERTREIFGLEASRPAILYNPVEMPSGDAPARTCHDVVFSGTLTAKKGIVSLIDAWRRVAAGTPQARLHVCGKDMPDDSGRSMTDALRERLGDAAASVHFHGHLPRAELMARLRSARAAVFPSFAEAFAMGPLEAMAAGVPTIYSVRGSGREIIEDGRTGLLVDPAEPAGIADAITRLLADDALAARLGAAGQAHVREGFAIGTIVHDNVAFYERCIHDFRRAGTRRPVALQPVPPGLRVEHVASWFRHGHENGTAGVLDDLAGAASGEPVRGLTLALCTYRRPASVARFLSSLAEQDRQPDAIVLVDASPDDATERVVREHLAARQADAPHGETDVLYVRVEGPLRGLTRQRNLALGWVATDLVVFFDDDVVLLPGCLRVMEAAHRTLGERTAGVGAFVQEPVQPRRRLWQLRRALGMIGSLEPGKYSRSGFSTPWGFLPPTDALVEGEWLPGCAMMWRTSVARELRFHSALEGYAQGEDLEFSLRALQRGTLVMAGEARVLHLHEPGGRPDHYRLGYMAIHNRYQIHRRGLADRRRRDVAWFAYAWTLDTLLLMRLLPVPGRSAATAREMVGRLRAAYDLLLAR